MAKNERKLVLTDNEWNYLWLYLEMPKDWRKNEMDEWTKMSYSEDPIIREAADCNLNVIAKMNAAMTRIHDKLTPRRSDE